MKKLIITIFIIFAYSTPQVFAVPPMLRFVFTMPGTIGKVVNSYRLYANGYNQIKWYISDTEQVMDIKIGNKIIPISIKDFIEEAFTEWKDAFNPPITFVFTDNVNEATIQISVDSQVRTNNYAIANFRGLFASTKDFGQIVIFKPGITKFMNDEVLLHQFRVAAGNANLTNE